MDKKNKIKVTFDLETVCDIEHNDFCRPYLCTAYVECQDFGYNDLYVFYDDLKKKPEEYK